MSLPRGNPAPRPALRRAPDADVHPAAPKHGPEANPAAPTRGPETTPVAPTRGPQATGGVAPIPAPEGVPAVPALPLAIDPPDAPPAAGPAEPAGPPPATALPATALPATALPATAPRARAGVTPQPLPLTGRGLRRSRGRTTSDALRGKGSDKLVDLGVRVPKSLRKQVRQAADARGMSPDELVALLLRNHLGRR